MSPIFLLCHASTFHTIIKHPFGSLRARKPFLQFVHLSQTQWHVSVDIVVFESSSSSSSFQAFVFFFALSSMLSFLCLMHAGKSPSTFLSLSLPPPSLVFLLVCWFPCDAVCLLTSHSLTFFSSFQADLSTAHSRCDEFFYCHFSICPSTSDSVSWYLMYARFPLLACLYHNLTFHRYVLQSPVVVIESRGILCFS